MFGWHTVYTDMKPVGLAVVVGPHWFIQLLFSHSRAVQLLEKVRGRFTLRFLNDCLEANKC